MYTRALVEKMNGYKAADTEGYLCLNANESSFGLNSIKINEALNRYPDSNANELRAAVAKLINVDLENVVMGNGSSEMIELVLKTYLNPMDKVMSFDPSFVIYKQFTEVYNGTYVGVKTKSYVMDADLLIERIKEEQPKIVFICNPNNPTGAMMSKCDIEKVVKATDGIVVVDEAYIDFAEGSMINRLDAYDNLVILRTFSKAWGMAGARLGYMVACEARIKEVLKMKSPYNLNRLTQAAGFEIIKNKALVETNTLSVLKERERVFKALVSFGIKAYKSYGNFIFFEASPDLAESLKEEGVLIRDFKNGSFRVTIGLKRENTLFMESLVKVLKVDNEVIYNAFYTG